MDPYALSTGELVAIAVVPTVCLAVWLIAIFIANRDSGRRPPADRRP
jgi:hypothetical protein